MNSQSKQSDRQSIRPLVEPDVTLPKLIGQVYESAPVTLRARIIEQLMRPLGLLGLMAVADGVFAAMRLRDRSPVPSIRVEDVNAVSTGDVVALANWAQQVSGDAVSGLSKVISTSPVLASSAAAAVLVSMLMRRASEAAAKKSAMRSSSHE